MSIAITCLCGALSVQLQGAPVARANCHCATCRDFYATSMFAATAWEAAAVTPISGAAAQFQHPSKQLSRTFCPACGEVLFGTNRLGMRVVPNALIARATAGQLEGALAPTMHLFYRDRVIDIADALPKYLDGWDGALYGGSETGTRPA